MFGRRSRLPIASRFNVILISLKFPTPGHLSEQDYDASSLSLTNPTFNSSCSSFVWLVWRVVLGQLLFLCCHVWNNWPCTSASRSLPYSGLLYIMHPEGIRNWENIKGFSVTVRGFSNRLRVDDKSVVLCISIRVQESPVETLLLSAVYVCLSALPTLCAQSKVTIHFCRFKNPADRKTFQIRTVDLEDICSLSYSRYSTFE